MNFTLEHLQNAFGKSQKIKISEGLAMEMVCSDVVSNGVRVALNDAQGTEIGRAYLYILRNDLHDKPFGLMEDVFVEENVRGQGFGSDIVRKVIEIARDLGCYKLIATSRYPRDQVHGLYKQLGFQDHGKEFRFDF